MNWRTISLDVGLGLALAAALFGISLRQGWARVETDFPNYYTGAAAARAGLPLKSFYDWTWFQREMNYTGTERQLGAYTPQTPLALFPFLPIAGFAPQHAKQIWLSLNVLLLAATIVLLTRLATLPYRWIFLIFLAGFGSLHSNFLLGQYYVLLAFLLTLSAWLFFRGRDGWAGAGMGLVFALKLYSGPFLLFFLVKRRWRTASAFLGMVGAGVLMSLAMFGWSANLYYVESVLPSVMSGMLIDPYNPGLGSVTAALRRTFVMEPELNPHPAIDCPAAFTFCQTFFSLGVLLIVAAVLSNRERLSRREFAWLVIALLLLAPVNATYVFALMAIPVAMLMPECGISGRVLLLVAMGITGVPLPRGFAILFPRAMMLFALFVWAGWAGFRKSYFAVLTAAACAAFGATLIPAPHEKFERLVQPGYAIAAMEPALTKDGLIYHGFGDGRYVLRSGGRMYAFEGHAFHPAASPAGGPVLFELVAHGHSRIMSLALESGAATELVGPELNPQQPAVSRDGLSAAFVVNGSVWLRDAKGVRGIGVKGADPSFSPDGSQLLFSKDGGLFSLSVATGQTKRLAAEGDDLRHPVVSPDGKRLAYSGESGGRQIWWRNLPEGRPNQLSSAPCNHDSPVWEADSLHLIFTSDCGRGLGLPGLYRAEASERQARR